MDKYDVEVSRLLKVLEDGGKAEFQMEVRKCWLNPFPLGPGCLFQQMGPPDRTDALGRPYGCLTQVKAGTHAAVPDSLGEAVTHDKGVPSHPSLITPESLGTFAAYQREADLYCNGG